MNEETLLKYLQGHSTETECEQVELWYGESADNKKILEQLYYTAFVADCVAAMDTADTEKSLKRIKAAIRDKEKRMSKKLFLFCKRKVSIAAAFLAGVLIVGAIWGVTDNAGSDYVVATSAGQRAHTILPDGSKVWLNSATKLTYRTHFWKSERSVDLSGEAYFEVVSSGKKFVVNSKQIKTSVLGTKFDVRARAGEEKVVTTLFEGSVKVHAPDNERGYLLKPGQTLSINTATCKADLIEYNRPRDVLLWVKGGLIFKQHSLEEITGILEKLHDIRFVFDDEGIKHERFTGEFSTDDTPEKVLTVLAHTGYFNYAKNGSIIHLTTNRE